MFLGWFLWYDLDLDLRIIKSIYVYIPKLELVVWDGFFRLFYQSNLWIDRYDWEVFIFDGIYVVLQLSSESFSFAVRNLEVLAISMICITYWGRRLLIYDPLGNMPLLASRLPYPVGWLQDCRASLKMPNLGIQFCALVLPGKKIERLNCCLPSILASFIRSQTLLFLGILEEHHSTSCSASGTCDLSCMHIFPLSGIIPPWQIETSRVEMHNLIAIQQSPFTTAKILS